MPNFIAPGPAPSTAGRCSRSSSTAVGGVRSAFAWPFRTASSPTPVSMIPSAPVTPPSMAPSHVNNCYNHVMRILLVDNLMIRRYGNLRMGPGRKLMCGAIRDNCRLCEFSDRDMARLLAPLGIRALGGILANKKLVLCAKNFRPDAVLLGHCDYITNETLFKIRRILPAVRIAHFNVDPVWQPSTAAQIEDRKASCDALRSEERRVGKE